MKKKVFCKDCKYFLDFEGQYCTRVLDIGQINYVTGERKIEFGSPKKINHDGNCNEYEMKVEWWKKIINWFVRLIKIGH